MKGKDKTEEVSVLWRKVPKVRKRGWQVDQWSGDTADGSKPDSIWLPLTRHDFKKVHLLHLS